MQIKISINLKDLKINRIVKYFVLSDLFLWGGWGLAAPILSVFVVETIPGATVFTAGMVASVYWITKSLVQMPVAIALDRKKGDSDDFHALIFALVLSGGAALSFLLAKTTVALYFVAALQGIAFGFYVPSWSGIFSRHMDKDHYAFDLSLDSTTIGLASGAAAFIGGSLAKLVGFEIVFIMASIASFASALLLVSVPNLVMPGTRARKAVDLGYQSPIAIEKVAE